MPIGYSFHVRSMYVCLQQEAVSKVEAPWTDLFVEQTPAKCTINPLLINQMGLSITRDGREFRSSNAHNIECLCFYSGDVKRHTTVSKVMNEF